MEERRGGGFRNRLAAANDATNNIKIKIRRGLKQLQNVVKNATNKQKNERPQWKRSGMGQEHDGGRRGREIRSLRGQSSWAWGGNLGKIDQYVKQYYFSANLENKIKSFDSSIDHPIAEVQPGGFCLNCKICAAGPGKRLHHGCVLF